MAIYFGKTVTEKLAIADAYFGVNSHILAHDWAKISDDDQKAALIQAEREVNLYLGTDLEDMYDETSFPITGVPNFRPDYAIFEHAYFILDNTARTEAATDGVKRIESEEYQEEERASGVTMSPQAMRYLRMNRMQICRG
jgi:hypothetical protein